MQCFPRRLHRSQRWSPARRVHLVFAAVQFAHARLLTALFVEVLEAAPTGSIGESWAVCTLALVVLGPNS